MAVYTRAYLPYPQTDVEVVYFDKIMYWIAAYGKYYPVFTEPVKDNDAEDRGNMKRKIKQCTVFMCYMAPYEMNERARTEYEYAREKEMSIVPILLTSGGT